MYSDYVNKLNEKIPGLQRACLTVVQSEKQRVYLKMLRLWINSQEVRMQNPLTDEQKNDMRLCHVLDGLEGAEVTQLGL